MNLQALQQWFNRNAPCPIDPALRDAPISSIMGEAFPIVKEGTHLDELCKLISKQTPAVLVEMQTGGHHIVTRYDIISAMS